MKKKICPRCNHPSFSASDFGEWICPVCGEKLSKEKNEPDRENNIKKEEPKE